MVALVCVLVFVIFFSVGAGPLPFLYMSEILSSSIKGKVRVQPCSLPAPPARWATCAALTFALHSMLADGIPNV